MELALTAYVDDLRELTVVVDLEPGVVGGDLATAIVAHAGMPAGAREVWITRTRARLSLTDPVSSAGLLDGDRLVMTAPGRPPPWAAKDPTMMSAPFELLVVGGPQAGDRFDLLPGGNLLGRAPDCTVVIADAQISRQHLQVYVDGQSVVLEDLGSSYGTLIDGVAIDRPVTVQPGQIITTGATLLTVQPQVLDGRQAQVDLRDAKLAFNRPPRVLRPELMPKADLPVPPVKPARRSLPLASAIVPLFLGVGMAFFLGPYMLLMAVFSPVMAAVSLFEERRGGHKEYKTSSHQFEVDLAETTNSLAVQHDELLRYRREAAPDPARILDRARHRRPELWERRPAHTDFLTVRAGTADLKTTMEFDGGDSPGGEPEKVAKVDALRDAHAIDRSVPVELDLRGLGAVGVCGNHDIGMALTRWIVLQAAVLDSPRDLAIVVLCDPATADDWAWTRWLPHVRTLVPGVPGGRTIASQPDDAVALLKLVEDIVAERQSDHEGRLGLDAEGYAPAVLLVLAGDVHVPRPSLARVLAAGQNVNVDALIFTSRREELPGECQVVVTAAEHADATQLTITATGEEIENIVVDGVSVSSAEAAAIALAPIIDVTANETGGELDRRVLLLDLLGLPEPTPNAIERRWATAEASAASLRLRGPLALSSTGQVDIDLRRDGPHGLVAGTTGAGKSELLQSFVASLATNHPPHQLSFVLVDYKGGAAFKDCVALPHTVGFFTDLDEHLAQRALISLNAELRHREGVLRAYGARDLAELEQQSVSTAVPDLPANLLIVIDEFAFLKNEVPEFVAGVVDIAQRGRSLGVHLLLATQRPTGVIDDSIRANTNLRIALRVADEADSSDVIDRPDAARIPKSLPGRAYLRTGHDEVREVQTAFGGASSAGAAGRGEVRVLTLDMTSGLGGRPTTVHRIAGAVEKTPTAGNDRTDLQRLVDAIGEALADRVSSGTFRKHPVPRQPWLRPLSLKYSLQNLPAADDADQTELAAVVGMADEPAMQRQRPWVLDLARDGHLLLFGAGGTGKTTALRTLAASLASRLWPTDLHLYALDFGSRGLRSLEALPHCGGVVTADEPERLERLLSMLESDLARRASMLGAVGASSLAEYRAAGHRDLPYVVVLLDGYHTFHATFENVDHGTAIERIGRLAAEGRSLGVLFVITVDRRSGLPSSLIGVASQRLIFRMASEDEYAWLGVAKEMRGLRLPAGRGFVDDGREVQVAVLGDDPGGSAQVAALTAYGEHLASYGVDGRVPRIELLPEVVSRHQLAPPLNGTGSSEPLANVVVGVSGGTHQTAAIDVADTPTFLIVGPDRSGRSTAVTTVAASVMEGTPGIPAYLLAPRRTRATSLPGWTEVAQGIDACEELAERLADDVRARAGLGESAPMLIVVDDGDELAEGRASMALETLVRRGRDAGLVLVVAALSHTMHRLFGGWLTDMRKSKHGLLLMPDIDLDSELFGVRLPRSANRSFPPGRGFLVQRGPVEVVQVAQP